MRVVFLTGFEREVPNLEEIVMTTHHARSKPVPVFALAVIGPLTIAAAILVGMCGCGGSVASQLPSLDPVKWAKKAFEIYDRNGDGKLATEELGACPSLVAGRPRIDRNKDAVITVEELQSRFEELDNQSDIKVLDLSITSSERPLAGATVTFTPEPFMGEGLQSYSGVTSQQGRCELIGSDVDLYGLPVGYYRVDIVQQENGINATRGAEVVDDAPTGNRLEISL